MAAVENPGPLKPHAAQRPFLTDEERYHAFISGIGAGKTVAGIIRSVLNVSEWNRGKTGYIIAPTVPSLRNVIIPELDKWGILERCEYNRTENRLTFPGYGSTIILESADNDRKIERLRGPSIAWFWMDEAATISERAWEIMIGRLRDGEYLNAFITTTPKGKANWVYRKFVENDDASTKAITGISTQENPHTPEEYREDITKGYAGHFYDQEVLGQFTQAEGLVYPWFSADDHVLDAEDIPEPGEYDEVVYGVDWGHNNPATIITLVRQGEQWIAVDEWYERRCTVNDHSRALEEMRDYWGVGVSYCDPSEPANIETFQRDGLSAKKAKNDVTPGIQHVTALRDRFSAAPTCQNLRNEFSQYRYKDAEDSDRPVKENDHLLDSLRYALFTHSKRVKQRTTHRTGGSLGRRRIVRK